MFASELAKPSVASALGAVRRRDGELVGYLIISRYVDAWHVMNVAVAPDHRRQRHRDAAARAAVRADGGRRRGAATRSRCASRTRPRSALYERLGFRPRGVRRGYYTDNREDALIMWRDRPTRVRERRSAVILGDRDVVRRDGARRVVDDRRRRARERRLVAGRAPRALRRGRAGGRLAAPPRAVAPVVARGAREARRDARRRRARRGHAAAPGSIGALLVGALGGEGDRLGARGCRSSPVDHLHGHVASLYLEPDPRRAAVSLPARERRPHAAARRAGARQPRACSARRSTTPPARPSTRARACSGSAIPGGAAIDRLAREGDPDAFAFPVARVPGLDFSFSGLKTALLYAVRDLGPEELERRRADLAASYQRAIVRALAERARAAAGAAGLDDDRRRRRRGRQLGAARLAARMRASRRSRSAPTTRR